MYTGGLDQRTRYADSGGLAAVAASLHKSIICVVKTRALIALGVKCWATVRRPYAIIG